MGSGGVGYKSIQFQHQLVLLVAAAFSVAGKYKLRANYEFTQKRNNFHTNSEILEVSGFHGGSLLSVYPCYD
jgi:hypothetical protein